MDLGLKGAVAVVTGASKGIGLACARALAAGGAVVVGVSRSAANLARARDDLAADGLEMRTVVADLREADAAAAMVAGVEAEHGPIGVLVNCAGARPAEPSEIADAVLFLASKRAGYITGAIVPMDGGAASVI